MLLRTNSRCVYRLNVTLGLLANSWRIDRSYVTIVLLRAKSGYIDISYATLVLRPNSSCVNRSYVTLGLLLVNSRRLDRSYVTIVLLRAKSRCVDLLFESRKQYRLMPLFNSRDPFKTLPNIYFLQKLLSAKSR